MKGRFRRIFSLILLPVLLSATNGIVVLVHTCLSSESVEVTLFQRSGCCADEPCSPSGESGPHTDVLDEQCCLLKSDFIKVNVCPPPVAAPVDFHFITSQAVLPFNSSFSVVVDDESAFFPDDASPPGRASSPDYIFSVHQLLI
jgi:hypothetical protein